MDLSEMRKANDGFQIYQNSGYDRGSKKRTLVIVNSDVTRTSSVKFTETLAEPFIIDKISDVYLDSFTTFQAKVNTAPDDMAFRITLDDLNIQTGGSNDNYRTIIVPNEDSTGGAVTRVHKGRKLNYISCEPPRTLTKISGKITGLGGASIANDDAFRFIMELVFIER